MMMMIVANVFVFAKKKVVSLKIKNNLVFLVTLIQKQSKKKEANKLKSYIWKIKPILSSPFSASAAAAA